MNTPKIDRRAWLLASAAAVTLHAETPAHAAEGPRKWRYCLNTATIMGQKLPLEQSVEIVAAAGYDAIEPWLRELDDYVMRGQSLKDLGKRIADAGLVVPSSIGFAKWIVDDEKERKAGLEQAKRDMERVRAIGGTHMAAPPVGATDRNDVSLNAIAERYFALAELGQKMGVTPEVELWGFSKTLQKLGEVVYVAIESKHPAACILPDVYHLYKGMSPANGLHFVAGGAIGIFHMNDYPTSKSPAQINDADRVYPGDGDAPLKEILQTLRQVGYAGMLSLELFNRDYWKQDAAEVVKTGLAKMKAVAEREPS